MQPNREGLLEYVLCVGFHHTLGNHIEFCNPPLKELPKVWDSLPFIALPDGCHKNAEDYIFFLTYSPEGRMLYGVACYRQVKTTDKLKSQDAQLTRSSVQKAVVALCKVPLFGLIKSVLSAATHAYFNQEDFSDKDILNDIFVSINTSLSRADISKEFMSYANMGLDVRSLVKTFGRNTLVLLKLLLAGNKIIFHSVPIERACSNVLSLCSLVPGAVTHFSTRLLHAAKQPIPVPNPMRNPVPPNKADEIDWDRVGFPLLPFSNAELVRDEWASLSGKRAHKRMLLVPYAPLQMLDELKAADGFIAGCSNELFLSLPPDQVHCVVNGAANVELKLPGLERMTYLTAQDRRFIDNVIRVIGDAQHDDGHYVGSDGWIRDQFREYLGGLMSSCAHVEYVFDTHPRTLKLTPELSEYGHGFVGDWMQTGCFARWMHSCDHDYVTKSDHVLHPSGPPSDAFDSLADSASAAAADLLELRERARKRIGSFFGDKPSEPAPLIDTSDTKHGNPPPVPPTPQAHSQPATPPPSQPGSSTDDLLLKFKSWWNKPAAPPATGEHKQ